MTVPFATMAKNQNGVGGLPEFSRVNGFHHHDAVSSRGVSGLAVLGDEIIEAGPVEGKPPLPVNTTSV